MSRALATPTPLRKAPIPRAQIGQTLIGLLVVLVIIAILAVIMVPKIAGRHHEAGQPLTPRERGYQAACGIYEAQINQAIMMYRMDHNHNPPTLDALKKYGLTDDMIHAPDCVFQYDPQTGVARNSAEGAQGVGGVVNPTSPEQLEHGTPSQTGQPVSPEQLERQNAQQAAPAASPYASHSIAPPGAAMPSRQQGSAGGANSPNGSGGQTALPGGLHIPNVGGMGDDGL